jgi:hypothetical protein
MEQIMLDRKTMKRRPNLSVPNISAREVTRARITITHAVSKRSVCLKSASLVWAIIETH